MHNFLIVLKKEIFPISLILILAFARLIPHPPNFTPIIAIALMSSYFFKNLIFSFITLLAAMLISDLFIGVYDNVVFVYAALLLIIFIFHTIGKKINFKNLFVFGCAGSLIFFIISNFGVWILGSPGALDVPYEKNLSGLINCYIFAIPFFKNTLISTIIFSYSALLFNKSSVVFKKN